MDVLYLHNYIFIPDIIGYTFNALMLLVGRQEEGHPACKN